MAKLTQPKITRKKLTDYLPDDHNANAGTERGLQMIEDSLQQDGVGRSIVADAMGRVPAGNKTLEAAMNAGITEVIEIETDGNALIVHKRSDWDLSDPTGAARRYAYRDNRAAEVGLSWSADQIAADVEAGVDLSYMFTPNELDVLLYNPDNDVSQNASSIDIQSQYMILIECSSELTQKQLLERFVTEGLRCRALIS